MGFVTLMLMIIGWLLIIFGAFGSGLALHLGALTSIETGIVLILIALCIGPVALITAPFRK